MGRSAALRVTDILAITNLIGECRELGDDRAAWRMHLGAGLSEMVDGETGMIGEMAGCRRLELVDLGVVTWRRAGCTGPAAFEAELDAFIRDPNNWRSQIAYHRANGDSGACLARTDFIDDRTWGPMPDHDFVRQLFGLDHRVWCFRPIPGGGPDEHAGVILLRAAGRRDFSGRDRAVVGLASALIAPLVGGPLARFSEPSPLDLPPRTRAVLACLLEGDGDKQVASRLKMAPATVNTHTRAIYRHYGVRSRAELMARWVRRGWGGDLPRAGR